MAVCDDTVDDTVDGLAKLHLKLGRGLVITSIFYIGVINSPFTIHCWCALSISRENASQQTRVINLTKICDTHNNIRKQINDDIGSNEDKNDFQ